MAEGRFPPASGAGGGADWADITNKPAGLSTFNDSDYVHIADNETITGNKTFSGAVVNTPSSDSISKYRWQNNAGNDIVRIDTVNGFLGVGMTNGDPIRDLDVRIPDGATGRGIFLSKDVTSPLTSGFFSITNASGTVGHFSPSLETKSVGPASKTFFIAEVSASDDSGSVPAMVLDGRRSGEEIVTRPILGIDNYGQRKMTVLADGTIKAQAIVVSPDNSHSDNIFEVQSSTGGFRVAVDEDGGLVVADSDTIKAGLKNIRTRGHVSIGTVSTTPSSSSVFDCVDVSNVTGSGWRGMRFLINARLDSPNMSLIGVECTARDIATSTNNIASLIAIKATASTQSSNNINIATGIAIQGAVIVGVGNTATNVYGAFCPMTFNGDVTRYYGVYAPTPSGVGALTHYRAFFAPLVSSTGENYGLYVEGSATQGISKLGGPVKFGSKVVYDSKITPPILTANTDDYAPTGIAKANVIYMSAATPIDLTGIEAGADGEAKVLINTGTNAITLKKEDANSTASNRFAINADTAIAQDEGTRIFYDGSNGRWRILK